MLEFVASYNEQATRMATPLAADHDLAAWISLGERKQSRKKHGSIIPELHDLKFPG